MKWVYFLKSETPATDDTGAIVECDLGAEDSELDRAMELDMIEVFGGSVLHIILIDLIRLLLTSNLYKSNIKTERYKKYDAVDHRKTFPGV